MSSAVVLDTNIIVAAGFRPTSASGRLVARVRAGDLRMVWSAATRAEIEHVVHRVPPLRAFPLADLFRDNDRHGADGAEPDGDAPRLMAIEDPDDRKFAALAIAAGAILVSNDDHLLTARASLHCPVLRPGAAERWLANAAMDEQGDVSRPPGT